MSQNKFISVDDLSKNVEEQLSGLDEARAYEYGALRLLRMAKEKTLIRDYNRLLNVLGPNHPRSARLLNKIDVNRSLMTDLEAEAIRAKTSLPDAKANAWILSGFVRDKNLTAASKLTVVFYSPNGNEAKELGSATTNEVGHYRLDVDGALISKYPAVHVGVLDGGKMIYKDDNFLMPKIGRVDYREMVITV